MVIQNRKHVVLLRLLPRAIHSWSAPRGSQSPSHHISNKSALNDNDNVTGTWFECGETVKLSEIFEAFRYRERPLAYLPESNGALFSIHVLGTITMDTTIGIGYLGGQGQTMYEDWDSLYGGRSSWDLNNDVVRERVS